MKKIDLKINNLKTISLWLSCSTLLLLITSCNSRTGNKQVKTDSFFIRGKIAGIHSGSIKLVRYNEEDRTSNTVDSIVFSNDSFELKGKSDDPQMMSVMVEPGNWSFPVFVENSSIQVSADTAGSGHFDYTQYGGTVGAVIKKYSVEGSKSQDDWMNYQNDPGQKTFDPVFAQLEKAFGDAGKDVDKEYKVRDQIDSVRKLQNGWKQKWITAYVDKNTSSAAGAYMVYDLYRSFPNMPIAGMDSLLNKFAGQAKSSPYFKSLSASLDKRKALLPGAVAPDFTLLKRDSSSFTLSSARGKYMMIDFWASWCHPCRKAIPHWKEVYNTYHAKGFDIVSVSDDSRWKDWTKAMDQEKMPWQQVIDEFPVEQMPARVGTLYMTTYIPFYVLLDKEGKIILYTDNEESIVAKLKELLG